MQATLQVGFGDQDFQEMGISTGYAAWYAPMHSDQSSVELPARSGTPGNYTREAEGKNCSFFFDDFSSPSDAILEMLDTRRRQLPRP